MQKKCHYSTAGSVVTADIVMKANHKSRRRFLRRERRILSPTGSNPCQNESPHQLS